ncbi:hypothetical protein C0J52_12246 [Blattella germanica]|nr:hypothetical protein C0J52_12246 [Blattella germanica]
MNNGVFILNGRMSAIFLGLSLGLQFIFTLSWDLKHFAPQNAPLGQVAVWRNRAFLSLPRYEAGIIKATLIEDVWPDTSYSQESHQQMNQEGYCSALQNVTALDIDSMRGRKWGPRAYIGVRNSKILIVIETRTWWPLRLDSKRLKSGILLDVVVETLALSRREPILYMTASNSDLMFALNISAVRAAPPPGRNVYRSMCVTFLGYKLGPSRGLVADLWSGLHYFLSRDHAAVRWDTRRPLYAESHSVLLQSSKKLPAVSHMFLGPQWQVWAVVGQHCVRIQKYSFI